MSIDFTDALPPPPPVRVPRGHPLIAWLVIAAAVAGVFVLGQFRRTTEAHQAELFEIQARPFVGAAALDLSKSDEIYKGAKTLNRGSATQRLCFVVLAGELAGPGEALARLDELKGLEDRGEVRHTDPQDETGEALGRLYHDYQGEHFAAPSLTERDRDLLRRNLGWFGALALNPEQGPDPAARAALLAPAERSFLLDGLVMVAVLGAAAIGFILLVLFAVFWRRMHSRVHAGSSYGGVYAETFALWLVVYVGLSRAFALLPPGFPPALEMGLPQLLSLSVLGWPVLRGVPWRRVRQDIGWRAGDKPALEPFYGILCYLAALPVVLLAALVVFEVVKILQQVGARNLLGPAGAPVHPVVFEVMHAGWWVWLQILFVASVMAPLVEETMFRGFLYRHLREATGRLRHWASVVLSALAASFVFAALHPQGVAAIPLLMALAFGFTAAREWRGSLLASMTIHALNNAAALLLLILMAG